MKLLTNDFSCDKIEKICEIVRDIKFFLTKLRETKKECHVWSAGVIILCRKCDYYDENSSKSTNKKK